MEDYEAFLEDAIEIADKAAQIALSYFRQPILIEMKANHTPVTVADRKAEESIRRDLERAFPDHGIIGEEFGERAPDSEFVWTVDPIDGTRSFIRGIPLFGTLIGLLHIGEPVLGVMILPALDETYYAAKGGGSFCNGTQIHASNTAAIEAALVACGDTNCFEAAGKQDYLKSLIERADLVRGYTDCFGHSLVLRGAIDAMVDPVVSIWDIAPLACLIREAGGDYYTLDGETSVRGSSFVTSGKALRRDLLSLG